MSGGEEDSEGGGVNMAAIVHNVQLVPAECGGDAERYRGSGATLDQEEPVNTSTDSSFSYPPATTTVCPLLTTAWPQRATAIGGTSSSHLPPFLISTLLVVQCLSSRPPMVVRYPLMTVRAV